MPVHHVVQVGGDNIVRVGNGPAQNLVRVLTHAPTKIKSQAAVGVGHFERGAHPFPEILRAALPEVEIAKRPPRLELTIDTGGVQQPLFRRLSIATRLGRETQTDARRGG